MKAIRTTKIKITGTTKSDKIILDYLKAINWLSQIVFKTKELNSNRLSKAYYPILRDKFNLPSQIACSCCKHVTASYKTAKANKRWKMSIFTQKSIPIVWKRDFNKGRKGITLWGEILTCFGKNIPETGWKDSKLKKIGNNFYILLCFEKEIIEPRKSGCIVGVDSGIKRMLVASNSLDNKVFFFSGSKLNHDRTCIRQRRSKIQAVGTRSSKRLLKRLSRKEAAITEHLMHVASKALTRYAVNSGAKIVVFEDLKNIRDASLEKGKNLREKIHRWPYSNLQFKTSYKLAEHGIQVSKVNPKNTSRGCPCCGNVEKSNRNGFEFFCKSCGYCGDADLTASINIRNRFVTKEHDSSVTGSVNPLKGFNLISNVKISSHNLCPKLTSLSGE